MPLPKVVLPDQFPKVFVDHGGVSASDIFATCHAVLYSLMRTVYRREEGNMSTGAAGISIGDDVSVYNKISVRRRLVTTTDFHGAAQTLGSIGALPTPEHQAGVQKGFYLAAFGMLFSVMPEENYYARKMSVRASGHADSSVTLLYSSFYWNRKRIDNGEKMSMLLEKEFFLMLMALAMLPAEELNYVNAHGLIVGEIAGPDEQPESMDSLVLMPNVCSNGVSSFKCLHRVRPVAIMLALGDEYIRKNFKPLGLFYDPRRLQV